MRGRAKPGAGEPQARRRRLDDGRAAFFIGRTRLGTGMAAGGTIDQVEALLAGQRFAEAARLLLAAAAAGETSATAELAHWRIVGNLIRRDLGEARRLLARAA